MKLFVLTSRIPYPLEKGDKLRIFHQLKHLSKNHSIYLCALQLPFSKEHKEARAVLSGFCEEVHFIKLSPLQIGLSLFKSFENKQPFQTALFTDKSAKKTIAKLIKTIEPNHIYCQLTRVAEYVRFAKLRKTIDYMDAFSKGMERRKQKASFLFKWLYQWEANKQKAYENQVFDAFDRHTIITQEDQKHIDHSKRSTITVIPNGVNENYFKPQVATPKYDLVFVGHLSYGPNVDAAKFLCKEILPIIKKNIPQVKVLLAGAHPTKSIQNLQSESITVSGWLNDIRIAYSSSKICIAPLRMGTGLQNKLLEAMAMQIACVTTPLANKALQAPSDAIHVGETAQEIAGRCIELLSNSEDRECQAKKGNQFVRETYSWSKSTAQLEELLLK
jgi:sugar transferase (PEP-CTERM/EpsH1 system associated)